MTSEKPATQMQTLVSGATASASHQFAIEKRRYQNHSAEVEELEGFYINKLYHQLTEASKDYVSNVAKEGMEAAEFVYNILFPLKQYLNPLSLCKTVRIVADRLNIDDALLFVSQFETVTIDVPDAADYIKIIKANIYTRAGDLASSAELLFSILPSSMDSRVAVDIYVNAGYQWACTEYFRTLEAPRQLYDCLMLYLAYTPLANIPEEKRVSIAFELCICGLVAEGMFDFGELRVNPILTCLEDLPEQQWILEVIDAAVEGSLDMFKNNLKTYSSQIEKAFGSKTSDLTNKMVLVSLLELSFRKPRNETRLAFAEIGNHCDVPLKNVEKLIMKAMSSGLIKGFIDSVTQDVEIHWVKPRMVDMQRIKVIKDRFLTWSDNVKNLTTELESAATELLAV